MFDETEHHVNQLAIQIADEAARMDIEIECPSFTNDGKEPETYEEIRTAWYDITQADKDVARVIKTAVRYLTLRGKIVRHPVRKNWVRMANPWFRSKKLNS
ncbi:MAG TPA: hypothetical protein VEC06_18720 [Paucimonas sp.]|nr:hypothetical protein [Paucimonas sp.]